MSSALGNRVTPKRRQRAVVRVPHTRITRYDVVSAGLIAVVSILAVTLACLIAVWLANLLPTPVLPEPIIYLQGDGGWEDGTPDATPDVESPEDPTDDPSLATDESDVTELMEITDPVIELSDLSSQLVEPTEFQGEKHSGKPGSAEGTGGRPLGTGGSGTGGAKREQRWFVQFADRGDLKSYARQLDFFGIELGVLFSEEHRLVYLSRMSDDKPTVREVRTGDDERRLFLNWEGGERKDADIELFQMAGIDARSGVILHFYPAPLEEQLARLELSYARRLADQIRRTYFEVARSGDGYEFRVTSQKPR